MRDTEQSLRILKSGGQVEDQASTLKKALESAKMNLESLKAKKNSIAN